MFRCPDVLAVIDFSPAKLLELFLRQRCIRATCSHCLHHSGHCFIQEAFALCQVDDVSDSQNRILGSVVFWMYGLVELSECVQVICYGNLFHRLDLQKVTRNQHYGHMSHKLTLLSVARIRQLVLVLSASHRSEKQHVLHHSRKKTHLILHHQDFRIPCSFAMLSFCAQSHIFVPEASNSVANSSVCCFGSECLVRSRIALCMGKSEDGIAVFAVLRREEFQKKWEAKAPE